MNRVQRLPDWLRFRSRQAAVLRALVSCLLLAPWVAEAQGNSMPHSRPWRGVSMRVRWFAGLGLVVALLAAYALLATSPLQAQTTPQTTTTTLIGNVCEKDLSECYSSEWEWVVDGTVAQSFTTGSETDGYPILEIRLMLRVGFGRSTNVTIRQNDDGAPGDLVATLTNPDSFMHHTLQSFAAPDDTTLDPDTSYWITVNEGIQSIAQGITVLTTYPWVGEMGETGWSIGDERLERSETTQDWNSRDGALVFEIKSTEGTVTASSDASLRSMYIHPSPNRGDAGGRVYLRPEFHPDINEYTAPAPNWVDRVTVSVSKSTVRASTVFSMGQSPSREDYGTFAIDHGGTTFTATVTAEDGSTKTYTVTLERSDDPPEPTDCPTDTTWCATMVTDHFRHKGDWNGPKIFEGAGYSVYGVDGDMSSRKFDHGGRRYTVLRLSWYRQSSWDESTVYVDYLRFGAEPVLPHGTVLQVDDRTFTLDGDSDTRHPGHHSWWVAADPFDWELGDHITVSVKVPDSDNANLGDLALTDAGGNPISLTPETFDRNVTDYTALVANDVDSVTLAATPKDGNATVVIANDDDTGTPGEAALGIGVGSNNVLSVVVTSQSGDATKTYIVTVTRAASQSETANNLPTGAPTISGTAQVGQTLTVDTSGIEDADGLVDARFTYQWERQDLATGAVTNIPGATGATYVVTADDRDGAVRVSVSFSDDDDNDETLTSYWLLVFTPSNTPAAGAPTISGTAQVGEELTADTLRITDANGLTNVSYEYQWISSDGSSDVEIANATASTYTVAAEDAGRTIKVRVSFTDDAGTEQSLTSAATALVQSAAPDSPPGVPDQPEGTAVFVGGVDLEWNDVPGADSYDVQLGRGGQWIDLPGDGVEVAFYGAGAIISGLDPEASLWFQVRAANAHGVSDWSAMLYMSSTSQFKKGRKARPDNAPASGAPVVHGTAQAGESLWADATGIEDGNGLDRVQFRYQWVSNDGSTDTDIAGATDSGYTLLAADVGKTVKVKVAFTDRRGYSETRTSAATDAVAAAPQPDSPATGEPTITGTAQVGQTLIVNITGIADADGLTTSTYSYQWLSDDAEIGGATGSTYTLVAGDEGRTIKVRVIVTDDLGNETTLTSAATEAVAAAPPTDSPATGEPTTSGTAQVGQTLIVNITGIADADGLTTSTYSYQWLSDDAEIGGATGSTYTLVAGDEGRTIKVRVIVTDDLGNETTLTSAATEAVAAAPPTDSPATGEPTISGTAQVGQTLIVNITGIADADGLTTSTYSYSYQWLSDDAEIGGATGSTYTLVAADEGRTIKVRVIVTDDPGNETTLTSAATEAVAAAPPTDSPATGEPTISGTAQVGQTLSVNITGIADADGLTTSTYSYQWIANDGGTDADISGATDDAYTLVAGDEGKTIKVRVIVTDDLGNETTLTSAATEAVAAAPPTDSPATGEPTISGTAQVGQTLSVNITGIADADGLTTSTYSYQWIANDGGTDADISGATDDAYTLVAGDEGKTIQVRVSFTDDAENEETLTSEATGEVASGGPTEPPGPPLKLKGTANADGTVTLRWEAPDDDTVTGYQILRKRTSRGEQALLVHVNDTGSTATEYTDSDVTPDVLHAYRVKAINAVGLSKRSNVVKVTPVEPEQPSGNSAATGRPSIGGTPQVGEVLTADISGIGDDDGLTNVSYSYQWVVTDGGAYIDISGATGATYTLVAADRGLYIQVRVSFKDDAGNRETLTSALTEVVAAAP